METGAANVRRTSSSPAFMSVNTEINSIHVSVSVNQIDVDVGDLMPLDDIMDDKEVPRLCARSQARISMAAVTPFDQNTDKKKKKKCQRFFVAWEPEYREEKEQFMTVKIGSPVPVPRKVHEWCPSVSESTAGPNCASFPGGRESFPGLSL